MSEVVSIEQYHNSQNAPVPYPTMLHSEQKCVHISVLNEALWDMEQVHSGIYEQGQLKNDLLPV